MASLPRTRLHLLALAAVLALACTRPGDDGVDKDPPNDETDTDVAPTADTSAGRDTEDTAVETVRCDLSTRRVLKASQQLRWFTATDDHSLHAVTDGWDPQDRSIIVAKREVVPSGSTLGGTVLVAATRLYEGGSVSDAASEHSVIWAAGDIHTERYANLFNWRSPDVQRDGRRDVVVSNGPSNAAYDEHTTIRFFDTRTEGFVDDEDAPLILTVPADTTHQRYSLGEYDGTPGLELLISLVDGERDDGTLRYEVHDVPDSAGSHELNAPLATILMGERSNLKLGYVPAVDVDADGIDDVVAWRREVEGDTPVGYLYTGPLSGTLSVDDAQARFALADHHSVNFTAQEDFGFLTEGGSDFDGDGTADLLFTAPKIDRNGGLVAVLRGPFDGEYTTDDAWLSVQGQEGDGVGMDAFFLHLDDGPPALIVASHFDVPPPMVDPALPFARPEGAMFVFDHTQSGALSTDDARVMVVNDGTDRISSTIYPVFGDVDGDGHDDVLFAGESTGVIPKLCP